MTNFNDLFQVEELILAKLQVAIRRETINDRFRKCDVNILFVSEFLSDL